MTRLNRACATSGVIAAVTAGALSSAGCGSSSTSQSAGSGSARPAAATGSASNGALAADARSAATGDIPDNQVFLVFRDPHAAWSMKYPEGWTQSGGPAGVTFRDKNNLVRVAITHGPAPSAGSVTAQLQALKRSHPSLSYGPAQAVSISGSPAIKVVYSTRSAPNPVTGKRVLLVVDRYELANGGKVAVVDLGTPKGVDNVDAYRMMIDSFAWR
jgi:hypothetical protein